jgi:hypothetical protein
MIAPHDVAAVLVVLGSVAALTSRDARGVAAGLLLAMAVAPLASSPAPSAPALTLRVVGALLATYLLWTASRGLSVSSEGSAIGPLAELALVAGAFCVGWWAMPVAPLPGSLSAQAAGVSVAALVVVPLVGRDRLRAGAAVVLLVLAVSLLLEAWMGPASPLQQLVWTGLLVGATGATSLLISPVAESAEEVPMAVPAPVVPGSVAAAPATAPTVEIAPDQSEALPPEGKTQSVIRTREGRLRPRDQR